MKEKQILFGALVLFVLLAIYFTPLKVYPLPMKGSAWSFNAFNVNATADDPWKEVPSLELAIRTNSVRGFMRLYSTWFIKSLKLFWPVHRLNVTLVMDDENKVDHAWGSRLSKIWPYPKIAYLTQGDPSVYAFNQRRRMFLSYFYPEEYVTAEYVGFVDTDTMFTTVVTPQSLFHNGKPIVQARIGQPFTQQGWECWSDVTEYFLGEKEALQCMSYFPIIFKVQHIVELRKFSEKRLSEPFPSLFNKSFEFRNPSLPDTDCVCQHSIICNYVWYHHRDEYDFHLQMAPDGNWKGEHRRESQQTLEYFMNIDHKYLIPKPRVAIHSRHYMEKGKYLLGVFDQAKEPYFTHLKRRVREGLCHSILFELCPDKCTDFKKNSLQSSLYSFEMFSWAWDDRCLTEQNKHYDDVKQLIGYNLRHGRTMFGHETYSDVCDEKFEFIPEGGRPYALHQRLKPFFLMQN